MKIGYLGRFAPWWASEREMAGGLRSLGHEVVELDEARPASWARLRADPPDLVVWTPAEVARRSGDPTTLGCPVVGWHLDRWWGLRRAAELRRSPWLRCHLLVTADGGHPGAWEAAGVRHRWLPPAIDRSEAETGDRRDELVCDVVFVGSWAGYLPDWPHRFRMLTHLRQWYGPRFRAMPINGAHLRGRALSDVYASASVAVGDSCLAGGAERYWSNRVPETLGRGGVLVHPAVEGMKDHHVSGEHLLTWELDDWHGLRTVVDDALADDAGRKRIATAGRADVLERHTFDVRAAQLLAVCAEEGLL